MRQFDVCDLRDGRDTLVVVLQHDVADELGTRIVAPLSDTPYRRLIADVRVPLEFEKRSFVLQLDRMAAIDKRSIGNTRGSIANEEHRIKTALDLLFLGA
jgi:toxin CcdB